MSRVSGGLDYEAEIKLRHGISVCPMWVVVLVPALDQPLPNPVFLSNENSLLL